MALTWTPEMKAIAKRESKALVKLQCQYKHINGDNVSVVGPFSEARADALVRVAVVPRSALLGFTDDLLTELESCCLDDADDRARVAELIVDRLLGGGR
jgi:hypothetical protein